MAARTQNARGATTRQNGKASSGGATKARATTATPVQPFTDVQPSSGVVAAAPPLPPRAPLRVGALPQTFYNPTRIIFSEGATGEVGPHAAALGAKRVMVISDPGVTRAGLTEPVVKSITGAGLGAEVYQDVEPDPRIEIVERALAAYTENKCDLLVAVGGGSSMDTAKAAAILATNPGQLRS
ncbi:MAG TPA: iron-containing alcohol dehydrogenase, partial [Dehalococcoidia bacterium]